MKSRSKKAAFTAAIAALVSSHALSATPREPDETALKLYRSSITVQIADAMPWYVEEAGNPIRIDGISYATSQVAVALMSNVKRRAIDSMNRPPDTFLSKITDWRADIQNGTPFLVLTVSGSEENLCNEAASAWARSYIDVVCEQDSRALQDRLIELTRQIQNDKVALDRMRIRLQASTSTPANAQSSLEVLKREYADMEDEYLKKCGQLRQMDSKVGGRRSLPRAIDPAAHRDSK